MLPMISGTVRSSVKLAELNNKWMQKKESGKIFQKEMTPEQRQIAQYQEDLKKMQESNEMASITSKLQSGQTLTPEEIEYLQKKSPQLYQEYKAALAEKEAYKRELKNCKTQEEADELKVSKMNGYLSQAKAISNNPNIPKSKKLELLGKIMMRVSGIQEAHIEFVKSGEYAALPTREEEALERAEEARRSEAAAKELGAEETMEQPKQEETVPEEPVQEEPVQEEPVYEGRKPEGEAIQRTEEARRAEEAAKETDAEKTKVQMPKQEPAWDIFLEVRGQLTEYIKKSRFSS